jgi:hypothetical protein
MNPEQFAALLALLGLPTGASAEDAIDGVQTLRAVITSLSEGEHGEEVEAREVMMAATARLSRLTAKATLGEAVREVEAWRKSHLKLEEDLEQERKERRALEMGEYRKLTAELVDMRVETPFLAWSDEKGTVPCKRILDEPLPKLRDRVAHLRAASVGDRRFVPANASSPLSPREIAMCKRRGISEEKYAETRSAIIARSGSAEV